MQKLVNVVSGCSSWAVYLFQYILGLPGFNRIAIMGSHFSRARKPKPLEFNSQSAKEKMEVFYYDYDKFHIKCHSENGNLRKLLTKELILDDLKEDKTIDTPLEDKYIVVSCGAKSRGVEDLMSALESFQEDELSRVLFIYLVSEDEQTLIHEALEKHGKYNHIRDIFNYSTNKKKFLMAESLKEAISRVFGPEKPKDIRVDSLCDETF